LWDWKVQTGETVFNERWSGIAGYQLHELEPVSIKTWMGMAHPDDLQKSEEKLQAHFNGKADSYDIECRMRHKQGHWIWVHDRGKVTEWTEDGRPLRMTGTHIDITHRKKHEAKVSHLSRVLRAIRNINKLITLEKDQSRLLEKSCLTLVEARGYHNAWIALLDLDGNHKAFYQAGLDQKAQILDQHLQNQGMLECKQRILNREQLVVLADPCSQCRICPLKDSYEGRAALSGRLEYQGFFFGLLSVSIPEYMAHDPEEQDLFLELTGDISFALFNIQREKERQNHLDNLRLYEVILSTIKDPMSLVDRNYIYQTVNQAFLDAYAKKTRHDIVGRSVEELLGRDVFLNQVKPRLDLCLSGEEVRYQDWFETPGKGKVFRSMVYYPYFSHKGEVQGVIVNARDITDRKMAEQALQSNEERFQKILALIPDMISIHDPEMNILYSNWNGFAAVPEEKRILNSKCYQTYRGYDRPCPDCRALTVLENRQAVCEEVQLSEGEWVELRIIPVLDDQGRVELFVEWVRDISRYKNTQEALILARKHAEEASKAKSEFLANMSHELRTPLNGIMGMMQLLKAANVTEDQQELLNLGMSSGKRLTDLLSNILELSSLDAGQGIIHENEFSIRHVCEAVCDLFKISAREKDLDFICRVDPAVPDTVLGDSTRLNQILFNLVGNAIKYTEQGQVALEAFPLLNGQRILFMVQDTGTGIEDSQLKRLFQPFVQADGSMSRKYQGAGLGLAIVRRLVDIMQGSIAVNNQPGSGTCIYVSIPFQQLKAGAHKAACLVQSSPTREHGLKILLAEDDPLNQVFIERILQKQGNSVILAKNGQEAVQLWKEYHPDCILMDIQMPVMTGLEATRVIRRSGLQDKDIPIIAVTAHTLPGDKEQFLASGMDDYLPKPVSQEDIKRVLKEHFPGW
ncbi:MAG: PAS domain S-box protein, partial [Desulfonatronovibrionaceae bacterium]